MGGEHVVEHQDVTRLPGETNGAAIKHATHLIQQAGLNRRTVAVIDVARHAFEPHGIDKNLLGFGIQRRQVKDLPITFMLDDSSAMSPATRISGVSSVVVSARISRSGQATPQPGDLAGQSGTVAVGSSGIQVELRDEVR
mgnify:CR=1 FL=1